MEQFPANIENLRATIDHHAIVSVANVQGDIIFVNAKFCAISGYSERELLGQNHRLVRSGYHEPSFFKDMWKTIASGQVWHGEICNTKKSGETYWVKTTIVPFLNDRGKPYQYVSIRTNITAEKSMERQLRQLNQNLDARIKERTEFLLQARNDAQATTLAMQGILASIDQGIVETDSNLRIVRWNRRYQELLGFPDGFLHIGMDGAEPLRYLAKRGDYGLGDVEELVKARIDSIQERVDAQLVLSLSDGRHLDVRTHVSLSSGRVLTFTDVTQLKQAEIELRQAKENAEAASQAKTQFLANMSHEIRTPINGILGSAEIIEKLDASDEVKRRVRTIRNSSKNLIRIIDDILNISQIETGNLAISNTDTDIVSLIENVASMMAPVADESNVRLHLIIDPAVRTTISIDSVRTRQIAINLLNNAIKFSRKAEGEAKGQVQFLLEKTSDDNFCISVKDDGIGISEDQIDYLFQPFTQADGSNTRKAGGNGLGLSIVKNLVDAMDGEIQVDSTPGVGSMFVATLPFKQVEQGSTNVNISDLTLVTLGDGEINHEVIATNQHLNPYLSYVFAEDVADLKEKIKPLDGPVFVLLVLSSTAECESVRAELIEYDDKIKYMYQTYDRSDELGMIRPNCFAISRFPTLSSEVAQGMKALTETPDDKPQRLSPNTLAGETDGLAGGTILLVEDNETNLDIICTQLSMLGYEVDTAIDGQSGLEKWKTGEYQLILSDIHMPKMDGLEMTEGIRRIEEESGVARTPVIAITANAMKGEADNCISVGMDDFLTKPILMDDLKNALKKWANA